MNDLPEVSQEPKDANRNDVSAMMLEIDGLRARAIAAEEKLSRPCEATPKFRTAADYIEALRDYVDLNEFSTFSEGQDLWKLWEKQGVHVVPTHYYSPISSDADKTDHYVVRKAGVFDMLGVDLNDSLQYEILMHVLTTYRDEVLSFPSSLPAGDPSLKYFYDNGMFNINDASLYHTIIRHFRPRQIIEVGSGFSLRVSMDAASLNDITANDDTTKFTVIEPFPNQGHNSYLLTTDRINHFIASKIQDVSLEEFSVLKANDILFLDSSHVVAAGSDTVHEFLKIVPRLAPGVIIHIHDIFLPNDLPMSWTYDMHRGWAEQYLLHAFLMYNNEFEVVASSSYIHHKYLEEIRNAMPQRFTLGGGSFFFRRLSQS